MNKKQKAKYEELLKDGMRTLIRKITGDGADIQNFINVCRQSGNYYDRRAMGKSDKEIFDWIETSTPKVLIMAVSMNIAEYLMMEHDRMNEKKIEAGKIENMFEKYRTLIRTISAQISNKN